MIPCVSIFFDDRNCGMARVGFVLCVVGGGIVRCVWGVDVRVNAQLRIAIAGGSTRFSKLHCILVYRFASIPAAYWVERWCFRMVFKVFSGEGRSILWAAVLIGRCAANIQPCSD